MNSELLSKEYISIDANEYFNLATNNIDSIIVQDIQTDTFTSVKRMDTLTSEVKKGLKIVDKAAAAFDKILASATNVNVQNHEVSAASEEQLASMEEISSSPTH